MTKRPCCSCYCTDARNLTHLTGWPPNALQITRAHEALTLRQPQNAKINLKKCRVRGVGYICLLYFSVNHVDVSKQQLNLRNYIRSDAVLLANQTGNHRKALMSS